MLIIDWIKLAKIQIFAWPQPNFSRSIIKIKNRQTVKPNLGKLFFYTDNDSAAKSATQVHLPSEPRHKTINTNGSYLSSFKTERKAIKCTSNVYLTVIFNCMTFTNPGQRQRSRGRGWKTQQAVWRGKWEWWKSSSTMPWLLKDWKPLVLHAQISCLCTLQVSASFFPPFLLLVWVYHPYLQFPAPCCQALSSMTPQILCLNSLCSSISPGLHHPYFSVLDPQLVVTMQVN